MAMSLALNSKSRPSEFDAVAITPGDLIRAPLPRANNLPSYSSSFINLMRTGVSKYPYILAVFIK